MFFYHEMMIWGGRGSILAPLKYVQVVQCDEQDWGFTTGLGFCLFLLLYPAIEPFSVLHCRHASCLLQQISFVAIGETLLSWNFCAQLFPMKN